MSPSINDLRHTLESGATAEATPDPYAVLSGVKTRATAMRRQRTTARWIAAATAVVAIGGTSLLLNDGAATLGDVEPAMPDTSYTDGHGIIDGVPQPLWTGSACSA